MTQYREYRGLLGEKVRVPTHTIAKPARIHSGEAFPFARMADKVGPCRDKFAQIVSRIVLINDALRDKAVKAMVARATA